MLTAPLLAGSCFAVTFELQLLLVLLLSLLLPGMMLADAGASHQPRWLQLPGLKTVLLCCSSLTLQPCVVAWLPQLLPVMQFLQEASGYCCPLLHAGVGAAKLAALLPLTCCGRLAVLPAAECTWHQGPLLVPVPAQASMLTVPVQA
jgi:hypothetical protein